MFIDIYFDVIRRILMCVLRVIYSKSDGFLLEKEAEENGQEDREERSLKVHQLFNQNQWICIKRGHLGRAEENCAHHIKPALKERNVIVGIRQTDRQTDRPTDRPTIPSPSVLVLSMGLTEVASRR